MEERSLDALLLQRVSSFAWATCGASSYVNLAATNGEAMLLVTRDAEAGRLVANNIEAPRLEREEQLLAQGWRFHTTPWHGERNTMSDLTRGLRLGADGAFPGAVDLSADVSRLRARLTMEEGERFRALGLLCAGAMEGCARSVRPGQTEFEIAGRLAHEVQSRGVQAIVNLIAADERVSAYRHPLPTDNKVVRYVMLVLCGRRWGLVCSITRLVHWGVLPDELRRRALAAAHVDAAMIDATTPGRTLGQVFQRATEAYAESGFADEWHLHHQGGPAGYEPREYIATLGSVDKVAIGQAYAWNPSITGAKSEDTILVGDESNEVLTRIDGWPTLSVRIGGREYARPAVLEVG